MPDHAGWYKELLGAITAVQAQLVGRIRVGPLFEDLLAALLKLSESEYGFIGETLIDEHGKPYLRTCAITNIAWNDETQRFYEDNIRKGLEFRNLDTLFGEVMVTEATVIANHPVTDARRGGLPHGHPALNTFLGLPLHSGGSMVGMLGVANRSGGYNDEFVHSLEPLLRTCANAIFALRADRQQKSAEMQLREEQSRMRGMLDGVFDGIVTIDEKGLIESINLAAEKLFGYTNEEIVGLNISKLMPEPFRARHDHFLSTYVETGKPNIVGQDRELSACRRNGDIFPVQLRVTEVQVEGRRLFTGILRDLSQQQAAERHVEKLKAELEQSYYGQMIGRSAPMRRLYKMIEEVAKGSWPVLIEGETGVGKELVARAIHAASFQSKRPFVATNIAGLTDSLAASQLFGHRRGSFTGAVRDQRGLFETADGGTLFLDEIGDISQTVQTSLLRVLEEGEIARLGDTLPRKVEVRVICATNGSLYRRVNSGEFRKDLLYRLKVARILVPPLRDRRDDLPLLTEAFLAEARAATGKGLTGFTPDAMLQIMSYEWPGNVRELRNVITFVAIHCKNTIAGLRDLPSELLELEAPERQPKQPVRKPGEEKLRVLAALEECGGNRSSAARLLGISRATFYRRLKALGIS